MERRTQQSLRRIIREIHADLDALSSKNISSSVKKIKKSVAELKNSFDAADRAIREKQKTLAKNLQQCKKDRLEMHESLNELRSLRAMTKAVRYTNNPEEILAVLQELAGKILPVEESNIFLFEQKTDTMTSIAESGNRILKEKVLSFIEEGIVDWIFEENRPVIIEDFETVGGEDQKENEKNVVFIPLAFHGDERGIFALYTSKPKHEFTNQDIDLLTLLSDQGAIAMENYRIKRRMLDSDRAK